MFKFFKKKSNQIKKDDPKMKPKGASIFVSHSSKDWVKVREIRNFLEKEGHYPLLFHLKCIEDNHELNELLKREIDARNWFVLCDSQNARNSPYVSSEVKYIKNLNDKVVETIDLQENIEPQLHKLIRLSKRATVFISCNSYDSEIARSIYMSLLNHDFQVFLSLENIKIGEDYNEKVTAGIIDNAKSDGHFIQIFSKESGKSNTIKYEFELALHLALKSNKAHIVIISFVSLKKIILAYDYIYGIDWFIENKNITLADFSKGEFNDNMDKLIRQMKTKKLPW